MDGSGRPAHSTTHMGPKPATEATQPAAPKQPTPHQRPLPAHQGPACVVLLVIMMRLGTPCAAEHAEHASDDVQCLALVKVQTLELGSNATHF
jgi:hypothetical protein